MMDMPQKDIDDFEKIVLAGMKIMFDKSTFPIFKKGMANTKMPLPERLAKEAAGLMKVLNDKAGGNLPRQLIVPAATMIMMEMGKFMKDAGIASPTSADMDQAAKLLFKFLEGIFVKKGKPAAPPQQPPQAPPQQPQPATGLIGA